MRRTEQLLRNSNHRYLKFIGNSIMKPFEVYLFLYNGIQVLGYLFIQKKNYSNIYFF